ncbi:MAG: 16S rRNA (cytosine(967)-C(5))-methyltransferase RsmB [Terriglobales bacterium]
MPSPAREAAFDILLRVEQQQAYASELLHSDRLEKLSQHDRALCTELVMGTLRWRSRLDLGIGAVSSQPLEKLDPEVLTALRLGAYQIGFLRLPARAAVNESVDLVRRARRRYSVPFANAVLRKLADKPKLLEPAPAPGPKTALDVAALHAHPLWLVERWAEQYGIEMADKICAFDQQVPETALRLRSSHPVPRNPRGTRVGQPYGELEEELRREGIELKPGALLASARRVVKGDVTHTAAFRDGRVAIQDEASQLVALLVGSGERLLDCCAAPGGKTAIMAERNPEAEIIAVDIHPHRAALLQERLASLPNVTVMMADATELPVCGLFDWVLADVPCSGTGTLARNPESKWRLTAADLADLHARQAAILNATMQHVRSGGCLVYSTCSLEAEENVQVVEEALQSHADFEIVDCRAELERLKESGELAWEDIDALLDGPYLRTIPGVPPGDGFFAAMLEKT